MKSWQSYMNHSTFRLLNDTNKKLIFDVDNNALTSFALDDALTLSVSERKSPPVVRLWRHDDTIVLGIPDSRLPYIDQGIQFLKEKGFEVIVRNSGGLAVALDAGVLNMSIILPDVKKISIDLGFNIMFNFVKEMFRDVTDQIKAYEIVGSYCPGDYDLSIDGVKFAGISQRRIKDAAAIQIYLDVLGNSYERAELVRQFYELSLQGEQTKFPYPKVNPNVLGSLSSLLNVDLTINDVITRVEKTIQNVSSEIVTTPLTESEQAHFHKRFEQMIKRNEKIR